MNDTPHPLTVRAIQPGDYQQWQSLWQAYQVFYEVSLGEEVASAAFKRFLDAREPMFAAVAVQNGQRVGLVHAVLHRSTWALQDFCYLEDLYVAPGIRGAGTGKALIEWVRDLARQHQCARAEALQPGRRKLRLHRIPDGVVAPGRDLRPSTARAAAGRASTEPARRTA